MHDLFIKATRPEDEAWVERFCELLKTDGLIVWKTLPSHGKIIRPGCEEAIAPVRVQWWWSGRNIRSTLTGEARSYRRIETKHSDSRYNRTPVSRRCVSEPFRLSIWPSGSSKLTIPRFADWWENSGA